MRGRGGVYGGGVFLIWGRRIERQKKITKIKYDEDLRWLLFKIFHATTNQKQAGMMEGGWDRPRNRARTLRECDGNNKPLADGNDDDNDKYDKDGNIPDDDDKYTIGIDSVDKPLDEGKNKFEPSQCCPRVSVP